MSNNKTKVLFCSPLSKGGVGGISKWTQYIIDYYRTIESSVELEHYYHSGRVFYADGKSVVQRIISSIRKYVPFLIGLIDKCNSKQYDVAHFCTSGSVSFFKDVLSIRIAHAKGVKAIIHLHFGRIPIIYQNNNWERRIVNYIVSHADRVIAIDKASYEVLIGQGYKNICFLPNPLAPSVLKIVNSEIDIKKEERSIVYAGYLIPEKGVVELVEACKCIPNIKLYLYGHVTKTMQMLLEDKAGLSFLKYLHIMGEVSGEHIIKAMLGSNVFVLPSYSEGFPNVIIESMACGCPIVATSVGAIPEMLDINNNPSGICVPPKDINKLKEAIEYMLDNPNYAMQCAYNARKRVNELYSMDVIWAQLESIWLHA